MKVFLTDYRAGARVATDLVNTAPEVRSAGEALAGPDALARFLDEHDLAPAALSGGRPTVDDLAAVIAVRRQVRAALEAATEDEAAATAAELVLRAGVGPVLDRDGDGRWQWHVTTAPRASVADELAVLTGTAILGVLQSLSHDRIRHCAAPDCHGMFVDTSKAGRRRYCTPDLCGNRLNVANHRARRRVR